LRFEGAETRGRAIDLSIYAKLEALHSIKHSLRPGSNCVLILPDRGERHLDTIFSDEWVAENVRNSTELAELRQPDV